MEVTIPVALHTSPLPAPKGWHHVLLDDVAKRGSGHTPSKSHPEYWNGDVQWISLADSDQLDRVFIDLTTARISEKGLANSSAVLHPAGTVVLSRDAGVGKSAVMRYEMAVSQHFMAWQCGPDLNNIFLYYTLQHRKREFERIAAGNTIKTIGLPYFKELTVLCPPRLEQDRIAEALLDADTLIESLEQLLTKKRQIKQGAMQELLTGKRRLPGFARKWKDSPLGELLSIRHGKSQKDVECEGGRYPILATGGQIGWADAFLYDQPTVLIGRKGTIDQPRFMDTPFWSVDTLYYSEVKEPNSAKFLYYRFCLIDWMRHNEASGVPSLSGRVIESIVISHPEKDEQEAIALVLTDMDAEITALESRLAKARALKQAMAQALLTGRIRLTAGATS